MPNPADSDSVDILARSGSGFPVAHHKFRISIVRHRRNAEVGSWHLARWRFSRATL